MFYAPLNYQEINNLAGHYSPSMVKAYNNATYAYWERSLFQRCVSRLETTLPENWEGSRRDFLLYCLLKLGFVFVSYKDNLVEVVNTNTVAIGLPFNKEKDIYGELLFEDQPIANIQYWLNKFLIKYLNSLTF